MESDDEFEEEMNKFETFFATADENRNSLLENNYASPEDFLFRSGHISIRSAYAGIAFQERYLTYDVDYDGFVVELKSMKGLLLPADYLQLMPNEAGSVRPVFPMLKKHIDLTRYSHSQLKQFKKSVGFQLLYSHGWEVWFGIIPDESIATPIYDDGVAEKCSFKAFTYLRHLYGSELKQYVGTGVIRNSLMKTALATLSKVRLLPDERDILYSLFQNALEKIDLLNGYKSILFAFRFGERSSAPVSLEYFVPTLIKSISVHVACTIKGNLGFQVLWSRLGLQRITGDRGKMFGCLSFFEACNWQSNLDGRTLDIPGTLRGLCSEGTIRFMQFYADTPHMNYKGKVYPATGLILSGGLFPSQMLKALSDDSEGFINTVTANYSLLDGLRCRLEVVSYFNSVPEVFTNILDTLALKQIIASNPLLVPFLDDDGKMLQRLRNIGRYLTETVKNLTQEYKHTGDFSATWKSLQFEMAIQKMLWGHQSSWQVNQHAINLGPGIDVPNRSLTDQLGFLALEESTASCASDTTSPPLAVWTKNTIYCSKVQRLFGFYDYKDSSNVVVGRRLVLILIGDLLETAENRMRENELVASCKNVEGKVVVKALRVDTLADMLSKPRGGITCYKRAVSLLETSGRSNVADLLCAGIRDLSFRVFPAIQFYDKARNEAFIWNGKSYFRIEPNSDNVSDLSEAIEITEKVVNQLVKRNVIYNTKLRCFGDRYVFPWTECMLRKLRGGGPSFKALNNSETIRALTFLSAVALMEQGWYVPYQELSQLEDACPLSQATLRSFEIQSQFVLCKVGRRNIWRIHPSIPIKLDVAEKKSSRLDLTRQVQSKLILPQSNDATNQREDDLNREDVVKVQMNHLPDHLYSRWSGEELCVLYEVKNMDFLPTLSLKYKRYKELCNERQIPDRSQIAFKKKIAKV